MVQCLMNSLIRTNEKDSNRFYQLLSQCFHLTSNGIGRNLDAISLAFAKVYITVLIAITERYIRWLVICLAFNSL